MDIGEFEGVNSRLKPPGFIFGVGLRADRQQEPLGLRADRVFWFCQIFWDSSLLFCVSCPVFKFSSWFRIILMLELFYLCKNQVEKLIFCS